MSNAVVPFNQQRYTIKRPFLTLFGRKFRVYGTDGAQVMFVRHKLLTLKDEWNVYSDDSESRSLLRVKARQIIGINIVTDIFDGASGEKVGAVRSKGIRSIVRDTWEVLDANDNVIGAFAEDSNALLRRFFPFLRGHWRIDIGGQTVAKLDQEFRFFIKEFTLEMTSSSSSSSSSKCDPRLVLGCAMLALMREIAREQQN